MCPQPLNPLLSHPHTPTPHTNTQRHTRCLTCHVQQVNCLIDLEHLMVGGAAYLQHSAADEAAATLASTHLWHPTAGGTQQLANLPTSRSPCCPVSTAHHGVTNLPTRRQARNSMMWGKVVHPPAKEYIVRVCLTRSPRKNSPSPAAPCAPCEPGRRRSCCTAAGRGPACPRRWPQSPGLGQQQVG